MAKPPTLVAVSLFIVRAGVPGSLTSFVSIPFRNSLRGSDRMQAHFANETGQWIVTAWGGCNGDIRFWYADATETKNKRKVGPRWSKSTGRTTLKPSMLIVLSDPEGCIHDRSYSMPRLCPCFVPQAQH